jgi:hypothetical protein
LPIFHFADFLFRCVFLLSLVPQRILMKVWLGSSGPGRTVFPAALQQAGAKQYASDGKNSREAMAD